MQSPRMVKLPIHRRQVNPAGYSGVTDQISNLGSAASAKAAHAASGLTKTQLSLVVVFCIIAFVAGIAALFWLCSCSRRRKRAREMREKSELLRSGSATTIGSGMSRDDAWKGESRVALNTMTEVPFTEWEQRRGQTESQAQLPRTPKMSHHRY